MAEILILDATGVLYRAGDDVAELLVPFVRHHGQTGLSAWESIRPWRTTISRGIR